MPIQKVCKECGATFEVRPSNTKAKYCSRTCWRKSFPSKVETICEWCGKVFETCQSRLRVGQSKFCSRSCASKANHPKKRVRRNCETCGKVFEIRLCHSKNGRGRFCSRVCYAKGMITQIKKVCAFCGKEFITVPSQVERGYGKFCSRECGYEAKRVIRKCAVCGKDFGVTRGQLVNRPRRFCSRDCFFVWWRGPDNPQRGLRLKKYCLECDREFEVVPSFANQKYCSVKCQGLAYPKNWAGPDSPFWKERVEKTCKFCGKSFMAEQAAAQRGRGLFCSRPCVTSWVSENLSGENSHMWRGGISREPYGRDFDDELKESIRERDGYVCAVCGRCADDCLSVHHIDYDKRNNDRNNLISLCRQCHGKTGSNRRFWNIILSPLAKRAKLRGSPDENRHRKMET